MAMTANDGRGFTNEELDEFLMSGRIFAKIATTMEDGWPVISPVWYEWDGESFLIVSKANTSMVKNLRRDQRCGHGRYVRHLRATAVVRPVAGGRGASGCARYRA